MKITKAWIERWRPCGEAIKWIEKQDTEDVFELIDRLRKSEVEDKYDWLYWAIPRLFKVKRNIVKFAVYCAELTLPIFEKEYPNDKRLRQAMQAAKNWIKNPTKKNRDVVARLSSRVAWIAMASRVAGVAEIIIWVAWATAWAAGATVRNITDAADAAWGAARVAEIITDVKTQDKIIDYGIKLLKEYSK